ncbi:MAG: HAMP domain-containing sensor histidine kinase [Chloroflexota bacterium]|nr:HAMP domain-containing protein [Chloroflexota bacterium]
MIKGFFRRFTNLSWRLTFFNTALLALLGLALGGFIYFRLESFLYDGLKARMQDYALTQTFLPEGRRSTAGNDGLTSTRSTAQVLSILSELLATKPVGEIQPAVLDNLGQVVQPAESYFKLNPVTVLPSSAQLNKASDFGAFFYTTTFSQKQGEEALVYLLVVRDKNGPVYNSLGVPSGYVLLAVSLKPSQQLLDEIKFLLIVGLSSLLVLTLFTGYPLTRLGLRPLKKITEIARRTRLSNLDRRVPLPASIISGKATRQDEIWQLAFEFNAMLDKIEEAFAAQQQSEVRMRQFVADASHELRSPLTILSGYLEVLQMGALDNPARAQHIISSLKEEINRLNRLVLDLLLLTRLDADNGKSLKLTPVELKELLNRTWQNMDVLTGERHLTLEIASTLPEVWVNADPDQLYRVLVNLIDNAIRYTSPGGQIKLSLELENSGGSDWAILKVIDNGCGIASEQLPLIFNRFYRGDNSRTRETGNTGLGLAISKSIVEAHKGIILVESKLGQGTGFTLRLLVLGLELEVDVDEVVVQDKQKG